MTSTTQTPNFSRLFWVVATLCGIVNVALLAEVLSTLMTRGNLAQLEMTLLLILVLFGLPVVIVSLMVTGYLLWQRARRAPGQGPFQSMKVKFTVSLVNLVIPFLFLLFFVSVKVFGYYWT